MFVFFQILSLCQQDPEMKAMLDPIISKIIIDKIPSILAPKLNPYLAKIDDITHKFRDGQNIYDYMESFNLSTNVAELKANIDRKFSAYKDQSFNEFLVAMGWNQSTVDSLLNLTTIVQSDTKFQSFLSFILDPAYFKVMDAIITSLPDLIKANPEILDELLVILNVPKETGIQTLDEVCPRYSSITLGELAKICNFSLENVSKINQVLSTALDKNNHVVFINLLENLGFSPLDILKRFDTLIKSICSAQPIVLSQVYNEAKAILPTTLRSMFVVFKNTIGTLINNLIQPSSAFLDFRLNTIEKRLDSLNKIMAILPTIPSVVEKLPSINEDAKLVTSKVDLIKKNGFDFKAFFPNFQFDFNNISYQFNQLNRDGISMYYTMFKFIAPLDSNISFILNISDALTRSDATLNELLVSLSGFVGGTDKIKEYEDLKQSFINENVPFFTSRSMVNMLSSYLDQFFGEETASIPDKLWQFSLDYLKKMPELSSYVGLLDIMASSYCIVLSLDPLDDMFRANKDVINVIDTYCGISIRSKLPALNKVFTKIDQFFFDTKIMIPPNITRLIKSLKDLTGQEFITMENIFAAFTSHSQILNDNFGKAFWAITTDKSTPKSVYASVSANFLDLKSTFSNIFKWKSNKILSLKGLVYTFVVSSQVKKLRDESLSFLDIIPLQSSYEYLVEFNKEEKEGKMPLQKVFEEFDYNGTELLSFGESLNNLFASHDKSFKKVMDNVTESSISLVFDKVQEILIEAASGPISLSSMNQFGSTLAREVGHLPEPIPPSTPSQSPSMSTPPRSPGAITPTYIPINPSFNGGDDQGQGGDKTRKKNKVSSNTIIIIAGVCTAGVLVIAVVITCVVKRRGKNEATTSTISVPIFSEI